jgi:hypothetical protein
MQPRRLDLLIAGSAALLGATAGWYLPLFLLLIPVAPADRLLIGMLVMALRWLAPCVGLGIGLYLGSILASRLRSRQPMQLRLFGTLIVVSAAFLGATVGLCLPLLFYVLPKPLELPGGPLLVVSLQFIGLCAGLSIGLHVGAALARRGRQPLYSPPRIVSPLIKPGPPSSTPDSD